ncbi:MAG: pyruvate kinase [Candidatus Gracilibacteria bacterium]|nr:pyruvate kinase [Candidatus Gracilibacteria bacterium]
MNRTRIVSTIGPATADYDSLVALHAEGMNVVRLNMSHGDERFYQMVVKNLRKLNKGLLNPVGLLWDLQGPEIRTGDLLEPISVKKGDRLVLSSRPKTELGRVIVPVSYDQFAEEVSRGDILLIDNGSIKLSVLQVMGTEVRCEVHNKGIITSRRHLNLSGKKTRLPSMGTKDLKDLDLAVKLGADWIALSYVRDAKDMVKLKAALKKKKSDAFVMAKIETAQAVDHFESLLEQSDGIMVARGDLGAEMPFEQVPRLQAEIVEWCRRVGKPVVIATHMLESMMKSPQPTRAEANDVAFAVSQETDATMLSGETAVGEYASLSVQAMRKIVLAAEDSWLLSIKVPRDVEGDFEELLLSAASLSDQVDAEAVIVFTRSGYTALRLSHHRPKASLIAVSHSMKTCQKLSLVWGVQAFHNSMRGDFSKRLQKSISYLLKQGVLSKGQKIVAVDHDGLSVQLVVV